MPATAAAPDPTAWYRDITARCTIHPIGYTAAAPTPTSCISCATPITPWQVEANPARSSPKADDWAGPTEPARRKSTTPTTPTNSSAETRTRPTANLNPDDRRSLECDGRRGRPPLPLRRLRAGADLAGMARSHCADHP